MRYQWPSGYSCAVVISFDLDADTPLLLRDPESAETMLGEREERLFGIRTGLGRLLELLRTQSMPASFYVPASTLRRFPDAVREIIAEGHEVGAHGDLHERLGDLNDHEERQVFESQLAAFEDLLSLRPKGFRAPSFDLKTTTPVLLHELGFVYDSSLMGDDVPYSLSTPTGPIVEVPVHWMLDDAPLFRHVYGATNAIADPDRVLRMWIQEFDAMRRDNGVFVLTLHPWIIGRASRTAALAEFIAHAKTKTDVWFATGLEIAEWHAHGQGEIDREPDNDDRIHR